MAWLEGWSNRINLTIDGNKIDENIINFPVLITLSSGSGQTDFDAADVFDELTTSSGSYDNRKKIAVTTTISGVETELYVEIERWDSINEQAWLWTKVPTIASGVDTDLYLYYDSTHTTNSGYVGDTGETPAQNVWDSSFKGVWHMSQDPAGDVADAIKDSTSNGNDGTPAGTMLTEDLVDGKVGKALDFDGDNDFINCGSESDLEPGTGPFTWEALVNSPDMTVRMALMGKQNQSAPFNWEGWAIRVSQADNDRKLHTQLIEVSPTARIAVLGSTALANNTDYNFAITYDGSEAASGVSMFINSVGETEVIESDTLSATVASIKDAHIASIGDTGGNYFGGIIDEVRMSDIARSPAWVKATYYSNWDDLITYHPANYFDGYVYEQGSPVQRTLFLHNRSDGSLVDTTTSSGNGYYYLETTYSGSHYVVCLDDSAGEDYNDLILGDIYPTTISG